MTIFRIYKSSPKLADSVLCYYGKVDTIFRCHGEVGSISSLLKLSEISISFTIRIKNTF